MCLLALSSCGTPQVLWTRRVIWLFGRHSPEPVALGSHDTPSLDPVDQV